jgi:hypothetical protein
METTCVCVCVCVCVCLRSRPWSEFIAVNTAMSEIYYIKNKLGNIHTA